MHLWHVDRVYPCAELASLTEDEDQVLYFFRRFCQKKQSTWSLSLLRSNLAQG